MSASGESIPGSAARARWTRARAWSGDSSSWTSTAAASPGSRNYVGVKNKAVDGLIEALIAAPDRKSLVIATRALDRVLLWNHYVVPQWHARFDRIAYWDKFGKLAKNAKYQNDFFSWWIDPEKSRTFSSRKAKLRGSQ